MFLLIVRKEILAHVLSLRFAVTFVLFIVLIFASVYVAANEHRRAVAEFRSTEVSSAERLKDILGEEDDGTRTNRLFWGEGLQDPVPVPALSWLGHGVLDAYPSAVVAKGDASTRSVETGAARSPLLGSVRIPDLVYVVGVVLSLLAILFMFDAVCGEKESGTLRLVLSNSVPRHTVLLGKWIGGYVVLLVPFLVTVGGGILYAHVRGVLLPGCGGRIVFLVAMACLYIAVFFNLSLFISTTTKRSSTALLVSLLVWVVSILAIPNLAPVTAKILKPTPSLEKIRAERAAVDREIDLRISRLTLTSGELDYGQKVELERADLDKERERRKSRWQKYYDDRRAGQILLAEVLGRLSPSACWTYAAVSLTNTGGAAYERYRDARGKFGRELNRFWESYHKRRDASPDRAWPAISAEELPGLRVNYPDARESAASALNDALILVIQNVIFFMLAFTFFLRYDVR